MRKLEVERFRGIMKLEWTVRGDVVCLVGPGDSTKSTILDAIECVLSPRWNFQFDDSDFHDGVVDEPIRIAITVGDLPDQLKSEAKFGYLARGWSTDGELHDEPNEDDELVLTIELRVDRSLEPNWVVTNQRQPEGKPISAADRERLGCVRVGSYLDRHFAWGRGSVLSRLTGTADSLSGILADAGRAARSALASLEQEQLPNLYESAKRVSSAGAEVGAKAKDDFRPHLDVQSLYVGPGVLALHDGEIPLRRAGLGTRRLFAIAMQREAAADGAVTLVDEVESGLEPHRTRRLLRVLCAPPMESTGRQVIMTTHASTVIEELSTSELRVVRCVDGNTSVLEVGTELQPIVRKASGAFLGRKVLVCEGRTELGLCRHLDSEWSKKGKSFALNGVVLADGGGTEAPTVVAALRRLGFDAGLLGDSDRRLNPSAEELERLGSKVFLWAGGVPLEQRIALDLPWDGIVAITRSAMDNWGRPSVRDAVASRLPQRAGSLPLDPSEWMKAGHTEEELRSAIGGAAQGGTDRKGWFKRVDLAEELGAVIHPYLATVPETDLATKIAALRSWAHG